MAKYDYIFGQHAVVSALQYQSHQIVELFSVGQPSAQIAELTKSAGISIQHIDKKKLSKLCDSEKHQGIAVKIKALEPLDENYLEDLIQAVADPLLLVLDSIQDPHNFGAILRTADAAGVTAVIIPSDRSVSMNATVRKVASGAAESVQIVQVTNLARTLKTLKKAGIWIAGTDVEAKQTIYQTDLKGPLALVMGAEGTGIRHLTREHCDFLVSLPLSGTVQSLNVSVATGICLFEIIRQRLT